MAWHRTYIAAILRHNSENVKTKEEHTMEREQKYNEKSNKNSFMRFIIDLQHSIQKKCEQVK